MAQIFIAISWENWTNKLATPHGADVPCPGNPKSITTSCYKICKHSIKMKPDPVSVFNGHQQAKRKYVCVVGESGCLSSTSYFSLRYKQTI